MKRFALPLILVLLFASAAWAESAPILLKSRTIDPGDRAVAWLNLNDFTGRHALVQFEETPNAAARDDLAAMGLHLLVPVPHHAYLAYIEPRDWAQVKAPTTMRFLADLEPEDKLHHLLLNGDIEEYALTDDGRLDLLVRFFVDVSADEMERMIRSVGAELIEPLDLIDSAFVRVDAPEDAWLLAGLDGVMWVSQPSPPWGLYNNLVRPVVGAGLAHEPPYSVDGEGVNVLIYDGGIIPRQGGDAKHPDLQGRLIVGQSGVPDIIGHANHVACTVAGDGSLSGGQYAGMAPGASIVSMDFTPSGMVLFYNNPGDIGQSYGHAIQDFDTRSSNNSIGANIGPNGYNCNWLGDYEGSAALIDEIIAGKFTRPMIIVWAAGNERGSGCPGDFNIIPPPVPAKNTICVGASDVVDESIASFSSRGPTDDGRLRPDVTAPGTQSGSLMESGTKSCVAMITPTYMNMSGTSQAAPVVTGATALALDLWEDMYGNLDLHPSLMKALVIHSAQDLGNVGPDYTFGYGGLRIPAMLDLILDEAFLELDIDQGDTWRRKFRHGSGDVKVTMVWTDPPGAILTGRDLVNDLNLSIVGPSKETNHPWVLNPAMPNQPATTGVDSINPVEQVYLESASSGVYEVYVRGEDVPQGPQQVSLVLTGLETCDVDGDGYDDEACGGDDCNDDNGNVNPAATEICTDGIDNDCNGLTDDEDPACGAGDDDTTVDDDIADDDDDDDNDDDDDDDNDDGCGCQA